MSSSLVPVLIGVAVIVLVGGASLVLTGSRNTEVEDRLDALSGRAASKHQGAETANSLLRAPSIELGKSGRWLERFLSVEGLSRFYEQADAGISFNIFVLICAGLTVAGAVVAFVLRLPPLSMPLCGLSLGVTPVFWLLMRRGQRIKKFMAQMPDAMELVGRALRAGHGLASGLRVVAEEMPPPISQEFGQIFEEQNLGIPIEDALRGLSERVPTMDVRFFVTAVVIQRTTGGDLAEVLDKISRLIRERFQILGQVKALTGEGRISGAVLLAMPPALMAFVYMTNPGYISLLWTTDVGKKMLIGTAILQLIGAAAIKKIVNIKV
jgi:tight adherence protein B